MPRGVEAYGLLDAAFSRDEVREIALALVSEGQEGPKFDFKRELFRTGAKGDERSRANASLLSHLCALANTHDRRYKDHGFLIFGAVRGEIVGVETTTRDPDSLSNHIEQLIDEYLTPAFPIAVHQFEDDGRVWGVVLVPPSGNKPHVLNRELLCNDPTKSLRYGDWYVRRGARTVKAGPEDYVRVLRESVQDAVEPLRNEFARLHAMHQSLVDRVDTGLVRAFQQVIAGVGNGGSKVDEGEGGPGALEAVPSDALTTRLRRRLAGPLHGEERELHELALSLRTYLDSAEAGPSWLFGQGDPEEERSNIESLEERVRPLLEAVATVTYYDDKGVLTKALLQVVKVLARLPSSPGAYTEEGATLRLYPLLLVAYTMFVVGAPLGRLGLLRGLLDVELRTWNAWEASHVATAGFRSHRLNSALKRAYGNRNCVAVNWRIHEVVGNVVSSLLPGEDRSNYYIGEFLFGLAGIEARGVGRSSTVPCPGLFLYRSEARYAIEAFLKARPAWLESLYRHPIEVMLEQFDATAHEVVEFLCGGSGFQQGALAAFEAGKEAQKI